MDMVTFTEEVLNGKLHFLSSVLLSNHSWSHLDYGDKIYDRAYNTPFHQNIESIQHRHSRPKVFYEKGVLRNFAKFTGNHLCQSLPFNEAADLRPASLLKKRLWHKYLPMNFAIFLRTPFLK